MSSDRPPAKKKLKQAALFELMKEKNSNKVIYNLYISIILVNTMQLQYNIIYFDLHFFIYPTPLDLTIPILPYPTPLVSFSLLYAHAVIRQTIPHFIPQYCQAYTATQELFQPHQPQLSAVSVACAE